MGDPLTARDSGPATSTGTEFATIGPDARAYDRYAQADLAGGRVLLYDRAKGNAWLTSDTAVPLTDVP